MYSKTAKCLLVGSPVRVSDPSAGVDDRAGVVARETRGTLHIELEKRSSLDDLEKLELPTASLKVVEQSGRSLRAEGPDGVSISTDSRVRGGF